MPELTVFGCRLDQTLDTCDVDIEEPEVIPSWADVRSGLTPGSGCVVRGMFAGGAADGEEVAAAQSVSARYTLPAPTAGSRGCVAPDITIRGDVAQLFHDLDSPGVAEARVEMELNVSVKLTTPGGDLIREGSAPLGAYRQQFHPSREEQHAEPLNIKTLEHPLLVSYERPAGEKVICDRAKAVAGSPASTVFSSPASMCASALGWRIASTLMTPEKPSRSQVAPPLLETST